VKARTLLLMCGLSLAGAVAADPLDGPRHNSDRWIFGPPSEGYDLQHKAPHTVPNAAIVPLPRPRPPLPQAMRAIEVATPTPATPEPPAVAVPQPTPSVTTGPQSASTPPPASAALDAIGQRAAETPTSAAIAPAKDTDGAAMPPVSVRDAVGGRIQIEAHDASVGQVLAALQDSHLIRLRAWDPPSGTITGTYTGTLPQVLSRILDGHDYFLRVTASGTELYAVSASGHTDAALRSGISSSTDAAAAPAPGFSLSPANPASQTQVRVTPSPAAKVRKRAQ